MAYIAGLSEGTKEALKRLCKRQGLTQIEWVSQHLDADLAAENPPEHRKGDGTIEKGRNNSRTAKSRKMVERI